MYDYNRIRKVVFYGRVSTEHEAQISALGNQMEWYRQEAERHPNWVVVGEYVDEGLSGTQMEHRPQFMQMLEDAKLHKFDLVVTREVCRFARNIVVTLTATREMKEYGVEVYFINDSIWTMDGDGELRLAVMASMAQEESRKISERVKSGQETSRKNGVLYGNGNILGYDLDKVNKTYIINEEQAATVRRIFDLYASGLGYGPVAKVLVAEGRKDGAGGVVWNGPKISRIIRNATHMGYLVYNKSRVTNYLTHKRINITDEAEQVWVKGNFQPIISEELWYFCNNQRKARSVHLRDENGKLKGYGATRPKNIWVTKLRCSCGANFRRTLWRTNANGKQVYGFECYRHTKRSMAFLDKHGLPDGLCDIKDFAEWKLELIAVKVFETVWGNRRDAVLEACRILNECYTNDRNTTAARSGLRCRIAEMQRKMDGYVNMRAKNEITMEKFMELCTALQTQMTQAQTELAEMDKEQGLTPGLDMDKIEASLCETVDFTDGKVSERFIDLFVKRITPIDGTRFAWVLDLAPEPQMAFCEAAGRSNSPRVSMETLLYHGAWPPEPQAANKKIKTGSGGKVSAAPPPPFLLDKNGKLNGDITATECVQDRLPSKISGANVPVIARR